MKAIALIPLLILALLFAADNALAGCDCRLPAYKDQMDFFARYITCLDDCLNAQLQQIRLENRATDQRVSVLEAEIERLNRKINDLAVEQASGKKGQ